MLEISCKNGINMVKAEGPASEMVLDICASIGKIHMGLKQRDPELAKLFQMAIMHEVSPRSQIWSMKQDPTETMVVMAKKDNK